MALVKILTLNIPLKPQIRNNLNILYQVKVVDIEKKNFYKSCKLYPFLLAGCGGWKL